MNESSDMQECVGVVVGGVGDGGVVGAAYDRGRVEAADMVVWFGWIGGGGGYGWLWWW